MAAAAAHLPALRETFKGWTVASRGLNTVRLSMIPGAVLSDMMVCCFFLSVYINRLVLSCDIVEC